MSVLVAKDMACSNSDIEIVSISSVSDQESDLNFSKLLDESSTPHTTISSDVDFSFKRPQDTNSSNEKPYYNSAQNLKIEENGSLEQNDSKRRKISATPTVQYLPYKKSHHYQIKQLIKSMLIKKLRSTHDFKYMWKPVEPNAFLDVILVWLFNGTLSTPMGDRDLSLSAHLKLPMAWRKYAIMDPDIHLPTKLFSPSMPFMPRQKETVSWHEELTFGKLALELINSMTVEKRCSCCFSIFPETVSIISDFDKSKQQNQPLNTMSSLIFDYDKNGKLKAELDRRIRLQSINKNEKAKDKSLGSGFKAVKQILLLSDKIKGVLRARHHASQKKRPIDLNHKITFIIKKSIMMYIDWAFQASQTLYPDKDIKALKSEFLEKYLNILSLDETAISNARRQARNFYQQPTEADVSLMINKLERNLLKSFRLSTTPGNSHIRFGILILGPIISLIAMESDIKTGNNPQLKPLVTFNVLKDYSRTGCCSNGLNDMNLEHKMKLLMFIEVARKQMFINLDLK